MYLLEIVQEWFLDSEEYKNLGPNIMTISVGGTIVLTIMQAWSLTQQFKCIHEGGNTKTVSPEMFGYMCGWFFAFLSYGIIHNSIAITFNGLLGFFVIAIILAIRESRTEWSVGSKDVYLVTCALGTLFMSIGVVSSDTPDVVIMVYMIGVLVFTAQQVATVVRAGTLGDVSITFWLVGIVTNFFWLYFGWLIGEWPLVVFNLICIALTLAILWVWSKNYWSNYKIRLS